MAITFPRPMPSAMPLSHLFEIERVDYLSPEASGRLGAISAGYPLWGARWGLPNHGQDETDEWRAWISAQRGPGRLFYGCDRRRPYPIAYRKTGFAGLVRAGGGAFDGTATSWSINGTRDVLTLQGLPAGFVFRYGDYAGFKWTTATQPRRALVRSVDVPLVANGAGQLVVTVEPPLPLLVPVGAVVNLDHPDCLMKLVPGETEIGEATRTEKLSGRVTAVQQLLP